MNDLLDKYGVVGFADGGDTSALFREIYGRDPAGWELENVKGMSTDQVRNILTESAKNIAPAPAATPAATVGNASLEALRARNPEMAEFMEWRLGEMDPMFHERIGARAERYNWDPYDLSDQRYAEWQDTIENAKRRAAMGGETPEWLQADWRATQAARNAAYDAEQERRRQEALNSPFVTGGSAPVVGPSAPAGPAPGSAAATQPMTSAPAGTVAPGFELPQISLMGSAAGSLDPTYNALADAIYGRKQEAWNTAQRSLEDWELAQIQGKSPEEVRHILQYSIDNWRALNPEKWTPPPVVPGVGPGTGTPIPTPRPPDVPPPYVIPPFTPPGVTGPQLPYTNPDGTTIYPNVIQTAQGAQPTYFPTSWWTSSPSASLAYGMTAQGTAPDFNKQMEEYRKKFAPMYYQPATVAPASTAGAVSGAPAGGSVPMGGAGAGAAAATPGTPSAPAAFSAPSMPTVAPVQGFFWNFNPLTRVWEQLPDPNLQAAEGGAVAELWDKYHG